MKIFPALDRSVLSTLFGIELKMLLRDRRTLIVAVAAPLLLFPAAILVPQMLEEREAESIDATTFSYGFGDGTDDLARPLVERALALAVDTAGGGRIQPASFERVDEEDLENRLQAGQLHVLVEGFTADEWRAEVEATDSARGEEDSSEDADGELLSVAERAEVPVVRLSYRQNSDRSTAAARRLGARLEAVRVERRQAALQELGFPISPDSLAPVARVNVASAGREGGAFVGRFLTFLLVTFMLTGGTIVAADTIAGEKERGTLENLLTTAARRVEIVAAKQLAVIAVGLAIVLINVLTLLIYLSFGLFELPESLQAIEIEPLSAILLVVLLAPLAVLVSSVLLLASGFARSYKEYQIYFLPAFLLLTLPALAAFLPLDLRSLIALAPIANISVAVREVLVGEYDWPFLALTIVVTGLSAGYAARLTSRALSTERLITASELDRADLFGGPDLFRRQVLRWFAVMWAVLLLASIWIGPRLDIRGQVVVNIVGIFLVGSLLMIRRYRIPVREALSLRMPHPAVWLAVLIGAPSGLFVGWAISDLLDLVMPLPPEVYEAFGQFTPETIPFWQLLFFLAVIPGVIEEIAFRGLLLYGLRRKLSPIRLVIAVGLIFGFFHVDFYRIGPTAYLGAIFAGSVLLSGSIYPAMLWHALNNGIVAALQYFSDFEAAEPPDWLYPLGFIGLAVALLILWRFRRIEPAERPISPTTDRSAGSRV